MRSGSANNKRHTLRLRRGIAPARTSIAAGMCPYDDLALSAAQCTLQLSPRCSCDAWGRRASSFCTQHHKSFAPWQHCSACSRARHFFAHSGRRIRPLLSCELPTLEGNSQFSQPTIRPTNSSPARAQLTFTTMHRRNIPFTARLHRKRSHCRNCLLLRSTPMPGTRRSCKTPARARRLLFTLREPVLPESAAEPPSCQGDSAANYMGLYCHTN